MIDRLIKKLGKPRCFLVMLAICSLAALMAATGLSLYFLGIASVENLGPRALAVIVPVFLAMWLTGVICIGIYYVGQFSGKYSDLEGRCWKDLPW